MEQGKDYFRKWIFKKSTVFGDYVKKQRTGGVLRPRGIKRSSNNSNKIKWLLLS